MLATVRNQHFAFDCQKRLKNDTDSSKWKRFDKKSIIPQTNNSLWLIKKGIVKTLTWNETGKTITLGYWGEGDVVGLPLSKANPYEAECLKIVEAICIPWEQCSYLFREISCCVQQTDELLRIVRIEKMYQRLTKLLVWLAQKFGTQVLQGVLINLRLTHQELADMIGSTRVTVTRLLNQLEKEEIIVRPCRFSIIVNLNVVRESLRLY